MVVGGAKAVVTKGAGTEVVAGTLVVDGAVLGFTVLGAAVFSIVVGGAVVAMDVVAAGRVVEGAVVVLTAVDWAGRVVEGAVVVFTAADWGAVVPTALVAGAAVVLSVKFVEVAVVSGSVGTKGADVVGEAPPVVPYAADELGTAAVVAATVSAGAVEL